MSTQASFALRGRNPDVLTCIANLSNDEVFTPPEFANRMLDTLAEAWAADHNGANLWADKTVRFLDPCTKSGVFLREITSRLTKGLADEIPDLEERVDHILTKQVFGIGITYLTSLLARRSVYCSKHAKGKHSIAKGFASDAGNIWFERTEHTWVDGKCTYCGASQKTFDRGEGLETHAYAFIHTDDIKTRIAELFGGDMQFDVIIGNPPYQLDDGGDGTSDCADLPAVRGASDDAWSRATSAMVIPSRWMAGGTGLDEFREPMLSRQAHARHSSTIRTRRRCFPGVEIQWRHLLLPLGPRHTTGLCECTPSRNGEPIGPTVARYSDAYDVFVRDNEARVDPGEGLARKRASQFAGTRCSARDTAVRLGNELLRLGRASRAEGRQSSSMRTSVQEEFAGAMIAREISQERASDRQVEGVRAEPAPGEQRRARRGHGSQARRSSLSQAPSVPRPTSSPVL